MPGWTVFHALISTKVYGPTSIGYCQAIAAPPSDLNTVCTVLKRADSMFQRLGQSEVILMWDEALYSKAQIIKWMNLRMFLTGLGDFIAPQILWESLALS